MRIVVEAILQSRRVNRGQHLSIPIFDNFKKVTTEMGDKISENLKSFDLSKGDCD